MRYSHAFRHGHPAVNLPPPPENLQRAASWATAAARLRCRGARRARVAVVRPCDRPAHDGRADHHCRAGARRRCDRRRLERPAAALALVVGLAFVGRLLAIDTASVIAQYDGLTASLSRGVNDLASDILEGEPFNLSFDHTEDLESSLADSWRDASGYLLRGAQAGAALLARPRTRRGGLYFVLRDGPEFGPGSWAASPSKISRQSIVLGVERGRCWLASSVERRSSLRSTRR